MPLYREWNSDAYSLAAIWKIEEPESFFTEQTGYVSDIRNEKKRLEHLAGRLLLKHLKEDFPLFNIRPDEHDKPRIDDNQYYFSISHSWPYVAAIVSPYVEAGIDIQCWHPRIEAIQHKFLSSNEQTMVGVDPKMITVAWSAKEAAYKWQGRRAVEFIDHMPIQEMVKNGESIQIIIKMQLTANKQAISVECSTDKDFALAYVEHLKIEHPIFIKQ